MARSRWKLCYFEYNVWRKIRRLKIRNKFSLLKVIYSRKSAIPNCLTYFGLDVHKGLKTRRLITDPMKIGYKFGEFSFSRKPFHFPMRKTKKKTTL